VEGGEAVVEVIDVLADGVEAHLLGGRGGVGVA